MRALSIPLLALLYACDAGDPPPQDSRVDPEPAVSATESTPSGDSVANLRARLEVPAEVKAGATLTFSLHVTNVGSRTVELYLRGRTPDFDVTIAGSDGSLAWRRFEDAVIPAIVQLRPLAPGASLVLHTTWDQRVRSGRALTAGDYVVTAMLLTEDAGGVPAPSVALRIR